MRAITTFATLAALGTTSFFASAQPNDDDGCPPRQPPPIAIEACEGKTVRDDCSFEGRRGEAVEGHCAQLGEVLACRPDHPPPRGEDGDGRNGRERGERGGQ